MQHLITAKETYQWYQESNRLKTMQSMEDQSKQRKRSIEKESKQHGINTDDLLKEMVLSNKNCFWSLLQSQTDRMHHYYHQQEMHIIKTLSALDNASLLTLDSLEQLREDVLWLQDFITFNIHMFELSVSEFDVEHHCDTYEEEMKYFEETYAFTNGQRLTQILDAIDAFSFDILDKSRDKLNFMRSKKEGVFSNSSIHHSRMSGRSRGEREKSKDAMRRLSGSFHEESVKRKSAKRKSISKKSCFFLRFFLSRRRRKSI